MRSVLLIVLAFFICESAQGQENFNFELLSNVRFDDNNAQGNDVWGWVSPDSTEYAIIGTTLDTRIYNLADPTNPIQIAQIPGRRCTWRDMKSWDDHVYVTMDCGDDFESDGLLVIDMSSAPDSVSFHNWYPPIFRAQSDSTFLGNLGRCHNLFIDSLGYMYLAGCGVPEANKAIIFDLNQDKWEPPLIAAYGDNSNQEYAHDIMVQDGIMYSSEIFRGALVMYDVTDKTNIDYLGEATTSFEFCHNTWMSDDGKYAFTTDELGNAFVDSYDVSDPSDIRRLDKFQPLETAGNDVVPHNTHYIDGYLVTSWYTEGVVITDVSRPDNMIKVGAYDTWPDAHGGTNGCWGAYPWLPSGIVLANDRRYGFFVLQPTYQRACYLEGLVTDANDASPINNVDVRIVSPELNESASDAKGEYKTGLANSGVYMVEFSHPDYLPKTVEATLENGIVTILDIELESLPRMMIRGKVIDEDDGSAIDNGIVSFVSEEREVIFTTDETGEFELDIIISEYQAVVGSWGYQHNAFTYSPDNEELVIELKRGYMDDFILDQGWEVEGLADVGVWERAIPIPTIFDGSFANINADIEGDIGQFAYVTGNAATGGVGDDDVDDGSTILWSPPMDLSSYEDPVVEYRTYFFNEGGGSTPNDDYVIYVTDGERDVILESYTQSTGGWTELKRFNIKDMVDLSLPIRIRYQATDTDPGHLVESALDVFKVIDNGLISTEDISSLDAFSLSPNPTDDRVQIIGNLNSIKRIELMDINGRLLSSFKPKAQLSLGTYEAGVYLIKIIDLEDKEIVNKIVKK